MRTYKIAVAVIAVIITSSTGYAQERLAYQIRNGKVYYENTELRSSDPYSFTELGYGYAKDRYHVYMNGEILPYVNPSTFSVSSDYSPERWDYSHREPGQRPDSPHNYPYKDRGHHYGNRVHSGYSVINNGVFFEGKSVSDATASSFVDLGQGYAKDAFEVYYMGNKIEGATSKSFTVLKDGYAKDAFSAYYFGRKLEGSGLNFQVLNNGYAKDNFSVWYRGQLVKE